MNQKAKELGMTGTTFQSVHGLPPGPGQLPDVTTARDLAILCRELLKYPDTLRYTSTKERGFRNDTFMMRNHNHLLGNFEGCDGLKTGYFTAAGFSIAATAQRNGNRVIPLSSAVPIGTRDPRPASCLQGPDGHAAEVNYGSIWTSVVLKVVALAGPWLAEVVLVRIVG
jgi:D-alanyl-D-alanine carboxypeptidase (penicillin-binding protein 5/6)